MARSRQHLWVCSIVPLDGPAEGRVGRYVNTMRPAVDMLVEVVTLPTPETVQPHAYLVVEIQDHRTTNADTRLLARYVRSGEPRPAKVSTDTGQFRQMPT